MKQRIRRDVIDLKQRGRPLKYRFDCLRIGDALDISDFRWNTDTRKLAKHIRSLAYRFGQRNDGEKFSVTNEGSYIRCTRVY